MKADDRDRLVKEQKLEAINAGLTRHERMARITMLLVIFLCVMTSALLAYHFLGDD